MHHQYPHIHAVVFLPVPVKNRGKYLNDSDWNNFKSVWPYGFTDFQMAGHGQDGDSFVSAMRYVLKSIKYVGKTSAMRSVLSALYSSAELDVVGYSAKHLYDYHTAGAGDFRGASRPSRRPESSDWFPSHLDLYDDVVFTERRPSSAGFRVRKVTYSPGFKSLLLSLRFADPSSPTN